jgi:hypothetical protein
MTRLLALLILVVVPAAQARPPYKKALADLLGLPASSRLNDCRACHLPGSDDDRPHNAFGARLKAVRAELKKAGKPFDITARLLAVAGEDADGDGVANLHELLAGHLPSDAADRPAAAAVETAKARQAELLASLTGYRWRPFERVERPAMPSLKDPAWPRNPIDVFLAAEHEKRGLNPRPEAPKHILLRRVSLDLTGLPPTPDELHAFLNDPRPDAYERVVDRLLASPRHGERWGRHWMDVWRYSDWAGWGQQVRDSQPHIWHWRDWILESLNEDRPYDRMVQEMLAADELSPTDASALRATGYLVRNYKLLSREKWMQDTVDHTAMAFLGVTLGCARCHDHMYDAISQREYYQVRAIFTPHHVRTDRLPGEPDVKKNGLPRAFDQDLDAKTFLFTRGDDRAPEKTPLEPAVPESLGGKFEVKPISLPLEAFDPDRRPFVLREELAAAEKEITGVREQVTRIPAALVGLAATGPTRARLAAAEARRASLRVALGEAGPADARPYKTKAYPASSTGRRLAFARWLTHRDNPLAARVAANHMWIRHFGRGVVPGAFDFGKNGQPPSHPALLDWLAVEFMERGWSMKELHRLMVTSAAYRQASTPTPENLARDPDNVYLWRFTPRRLEAEAVRDAVFHVAGGLDAKMGGPDIPHAAGLDTPRRSVYFQHAQEKQMEFLQIFDCASVTECYVRKQAILPQQALALINSDLVLAQARRLAGQINGDDGVFVRAAFERVLSRPPTGEEAATCVEFLRGRGGRGRENLVHVLYNHHEFATLR